EVAGLRLHLVHAPSETDNELVVWLPDLKVLQSAEVIQGECFPNLHTIRGTPYRDPVNWYKSIDMMRGFGAEHLVPTHGRPVSGKAAVDELLTAYRDAIQYTHDQAVRYINKGYTPDELAERLPGLPAHLAGHPWLGEFYGTVKHSVRQIFGGYLGWFEGDPTFLDPLPRGEAARRQVAMMGGREAVLAAAREALAADDHQWAAQLLTHLTRLDEDDMEARQLKAGALRALGYATRNINWRDWYLTSAMELDDSLPEAARQAGGFSPAVIAALPTARIVETASVRLRAEDCFDARYCLAIEVSDTYESMGLEVRRGVAQFHPRRPDRADGTLTGTKMTIMGLFAQMLSLEEALDGGDASLLGEREELARFLGYFEPPMGARMRLTLR
ncbi:MAG: alkyl sulfatase dimerization domain-containing protein, partial [Alphaproteobacteria bacterium]|nr:alkyl sulfatase dimerization domain-containing protein [Alphaproteobacteria bacterium]